MGRILSIDYGKQRCGLAVTDPLQIIASPLQVVHPKELIYFLKQYTLKEEVEKVIIGYPLLMNGADTDVTAAVRKFISNFEKVFPLIPIEKVDEAYSSQQAAHEIHLMQLPKAKKQQKGILDEVAATLLLQEYLTQSSSKNRE